MYCYDVVQVRRSGRLRDDKEQQNKRGKVVVDGKSHEQFLMIFAVGCL